MVSMSDIGRKADVVADVCKWVVSRQAASRRASSEIGHSTYDLKAVLTLQICLSPQAAVSSRSINLKPIYSSRS